VELNQAQLCQGSAKIAAAKYEYLRRRAELGYGDGSLAMTKNGWVLVVLAAPLLLCSCGKTSASVDSLGAPKAVPIVLVAKPHGRRWPAISCSLPSSSPCSR
jgi:hypothetical protein